jgi:hypothetical protein
MTLQAHSDIMKQVFSKLGIAPEKVTHEMRVFAAQVMHEMGVSLEVGDHSEVSRSGSLCWQLCFQHGATRFGAGITDCPVW